MTHFAKFFCFVSLLTLAVTGQAAANPNQEETAALKAQLDGRVQELLTAVDGVFDVEYSDGFISRIKIKYTVEVSTSVQGARADRLATENANRRARAAFSSFLNSDVVFVESGNEVVMITTKDSTETSDITEASASSINTASQSFQRGLIPLLQHCEGEGNMRTCTVVLGWSQKLVKASMQAQGAMKRDPEPATTDAPAPKKAPQQQPGGNTQTKTRKGDADF